MTAIVSPHSAKTRGHDWYHALLEHTDEPALVFDVRSGRLVDVNPAAATLLARSPGKLCELALVDLFTRASLGTVKRACEGLLATGSARFEARIRSADHGLCDLAVTAERLDTPEGTLCLALLKEIVSRERLERDVRLYRSIVQNSRDAVLISDARNRIVEVNPAFTETTGYTRDEVIGRNPNMLSSGETPQETYVALWSALSATGSWEGELVDRRKDGSLYPKWVSIVAVRDKTGAITNYVATFTDITERKKVEAHIEFLAYNDVLTKLSNRLGLSLRLAQALAGAQENRAGLAVLFIDLDRFKDVNDTLGHQAGDRVLIDAAQRLRASVRTSDIVSRIGGDEFVVVLTPAGTRADATAIAQKIRWQLGRPYQIDERVVHCSASIGVALYPEDGDGVETLLKQADAAMYYVKEHGHDGVQFFTEEMAAAARRRVELEHDLRLALEDGSITVHYQPQFRASDGALFGMEALARWHHPLRGPIAPDHFIPLAEASGLIEALGRLVLAQVCRQAALWRKMGIGPARIAINLSARQLMSEDLVPLIQATLGEHELPAAVLEIEITESVAMEDPERAVLQLLRLRDKGIRLTLDDFGTGYSSLAYLNSLPIHALKLDRMFVRDLATDPNNATISSVTIALAHALGLEVVAEGVETDAQRRFLVEQGCDGLQGYLLGRPLPASHWTDFWLRASSAD